MRPPGAVYAEVRVTRMLDGEIIEQRVASMHPDRVDYWLRAEGLMPGEVVQYDVRYFDESGRRVSALTTMEGAP